MKDFKFDRLFVDKAFDKDEELELEIDGDEDNSCYIFLPREEVVRLRDHLNAVLGVAS